MSAISQAVMQIEIVEKPGQSLYNAPHHPSPGGSSPSAPRSTSPSDTSSRPAPPTVPASNPNATLAQKIDTILADKNAKKMLGGLDAETLNKPGMDRFVDQLFAALGSRQQEPVKTTPVEPVRGNQELRELQAISGHLADIRRSKGAKAMEPPAPDVYGFADDSESSGVYGLQKPEPRAKSAVEQVMQAAENAADKDAARKAEDAKKPYGFKDAKDRVEAGETFAVQPAEEKPGSGLPRGRPLGPVGRVVSDEERSRDQWSTSGFGKDLTRWIPHGIGTTLGNKWEAVSGGYKAASAEAAAGGAGRMGQMAAGMGEAAAAAGPAAALVAVIAANKLAASAMNKASHGVEALGNQTARLAGNDHMGLFNSAVDGAKDALSSIPIVGEKYAAELALATAPVRAFTTAVSAFVSRAKELEGYSGSIAQANVGAELRSLQGDMREAQQLGAGLARLTDAQSRADDEIRQLLLPIKRVVVDVLASFLEAGMDGWNFIKPIVREIGDAATEGVVVLEKIATTVVDPLNIYGIKQLIEDFKESIKKRDAGGDVLPIVDWLAAADKIGRRDAVIGQGHPNPNPGPLFPGFGNQLGM